MEVDYSARRTGKTTRLIEWLREDEGRVMITFSHMEENRLKREFPELSTQIVDWESYQNRYRQGRKIKEVGIDNADMILQSMIPEQIKIISISEI